MINEKMVNEIVDEVYKRLNFYQNKKTAVVIGNVEDIDITKFNYNIVPYTPGIPDCDCIVIGNMDISMMSHLALGCPHNEVENYIVRALLNKKKVYVAELAYRKYKDIASKTLYHLYYEYENKIENYGVTILEDSKNTYQEDFHKDCTIKSSMAITKKLILESDVSKIYRSGLKNVVVDDKCIITPLAIDFIKTHNMSIERTL